MKYISIFKSAREVIKCDKQCRAVGMSVRIVPVPERYSSSCGMSIEFDSETKDSFEKIVEDLGIEVKIYEK